VWNELRPEAVTQAVQRSDAPPRGGSPYRALEVTAQARSIATAAKPDPNLAAVPIVFAVAMCLSLLIQAIAAATVAGCSAIVFAAGRFIASRVRAPLLEADSGGLRAVPRRRRSPSRLCRPRDGPTS
jgi:hypothetical protein